MRPTIVLRASSRRSVPASDVLDVLDVSRFEARLRTPRMRELYGAPPATGLYRIEHRRPTRKRESQ